MTRRPATRSPRRPRNPLAELDRRGRLALAAMALVALLGAAAAIGGGGGAGDRGDRAVNASGAASSAGDSSSASAAFERDAAPTTVAAGDRDVDGSAAEAPGDGSGAGDTSFATAPGAPVDAKIIRTGDLELEVGRGRFEAVTTRLGAIATAAGGFVSASETSALDDEPRGSLTLRVPAATFDTVVGQVGEEGDVQAVNTGSQDVTGEYTDVASRLKALESERAQIDLVLGRAETIPDILSVRDRLSVVQAEIEQLQGRQQVLDDQTSLSTLTVSLHEAGDRAAASAVPAERSGFSRLWHDSVDRFSDGGRSIALGLASMAPWLLLALVLFVPARLLWHRHAPADTTGPPPAATAAD